MVWGPIGIMTVTDTVKRVVVGRPLVPTDRAGLDAAPAAFAAGAVRDLPAVRVPVGARYAAGGLAGLADRSSRPRRMPRRAAPAVEARVEFLEP